MSDRSRLRLFVLRVLVVSLLLTLVGRLWYLQVLAGDTYAKAASNLSTRDIVTAAARGQIFDDLGRPLARNQTALVVSVDRIALQRQPDHGIAVLKRLSSVVRVPLAQLRHRITPCGPGIAKPCWNGSPYQPIPVTDNADTAMAMKILEQQELFPGVTAEEQAIRQYPLPGKANAAHLLGYLRPVTADDLKKRRSRDIQIRGSDLIGAAGLESSYDRFLRGVAGLHTVSVDAAGAVTGTLSESTPEPGANVVTSLDAGVQHVLEVALANAMKSARKSYDKTRGKNYVADSAAGVVLDARTGHVVAMASLPTYNPNIWVGGISQKEFDGLGSKANGQPILDRATNGEFAPGSTFKLVTTTGTIKEGRADFGSTYNCPGKLMVGNAFKSNFEGESGGHLSLHQTLVQSCDTVFYQFAIDDWYHDEALVRAGKKAIEGVQKMARSFGFGKPTGIDLPTDQNGHIEDRASKMAFWKSFLRKNACAGAKTRPKGSYLQRLDAENCSDGWRFRLGDQANFDIGQGTVLATPLQLAVAYQALVNGGKVVAPRLGKAVIDPSGKLIARITPPVVNDLGVSQSVLDNIMAALYDVTRAKKGTARGAFTGFDFAKVKVGGKTGTADVASKQPTSWFASFGGPVGQAPQYVVVTMITQAGQGGKVAAPAARAVWEGIYGLHGHRPALAGGAPPAALPVFFTDGTVHPPGTRLPPAPKKPKTPKATPTAAALGPNRYGRLW
ncbi:MAG: penicillin-binding protein 2 [Frankiales bacterium]|nr:penicillin-binding protein 2 [Frankiales bacterium]